MSRQNAQRARPRSLGKRLTPKQAAFTHHYSNRKSDTFGNGTRSCKRSGYKGHAGTLAVQASRNLRHPAIREEVRTALYEQGFTPEFAAKTLMGAMRATIVRALPNREGKPVPHKFPDHRMRLQGLDRAWRLVGENKPYSAQSESRLIDIKDIQEYAATAARVLAPPVDPMNLSESVREALAEVERLSPIDRMLLRDAYEATARYLELGGNLADLDKSLGIGSTDGPSQAGSGQLERPGFGPVGEGP